MTTYMKTYFYLIVTITASWSLNFQQSFNDTEISNNTYYIESIENTMSSTKQASSTFTTNDDKQHHLSNSDITQSNILFTSTVVMTFLLICCCISSIIFIKYHFNHQMRLRKKSFEIQKQTNKQIASDVNIDDIIFDNNNQSDMSLLINNQSDTDDMYCRNTKAIDLDGSITAIPYYNKQLDPVKLWFYTKVTNTKCDMMIIIINLLKMDMKQWIL